MSGGTSFEHTWIQLLPAYKKLYPEEGHLFGRQEVASSHTSHICLFYLKGRLGGVLRQIVNGLRSRKI